MGLYDNTRPTDLRHEHAHALAEMVQELERTADKVAMGKREAAQLISGALVTSKEGVARFETAGKRLAATVEASTEHFARAVDEKGGSLIHHLAGVARDLALAGDAVALQSVNAMQAPTELLTAAAVRLEAAAAEAESNRATASDARMKLIDYRKEIDAHEGLVHQRLAEAKAKAYAGLGFWARVWAVVSPPTVAANIPAAPVRPKLAKQQKPQERPSA